jgi:acetyltransferase-like isoleucine patch superfamily enzyme
MSHLKLFQFRKTFKKQYPLSRLNPMNVFDMNKISVGRYNYGELHLQVWQSKEQKLIVGDFVSIAPGVLFLLGGNHRYDTISTYPFDAELNDFDFTSGKIEEEKTNGPIILKDDVWIGTKAMIVSGVTIHQGAIVAAGSVVTKDVPPYAIVGGNPAKVIKYRFDDATIQQLRAKADYSKLTIEKIEKNISLFSTPLDNNNISSLLDLFGS